MTTSSLVKSLSAELTKAADTPPPGFSPSVTYVGQQPDMITTPLVTPVETQEEMKAIVTSMGVPLPDGCALELVEAKLDMGAWSRREHFIEHPETGLKTKAPALREPCWRYRFKVVRSTSLPDADLKALFAEADRTARTHRPVKPAAQSETLVVSLGDFQVGKTDYRGGTEELLARNAIAKKAVVARIRKMKPAQVVLLDAGDAMEMFQSSPNASQTNDKSTTEQQRIWRRMLWGWIRDLAPLTNDMVIAGVPSNHCRVREGKNYVGPTDDDFGLEVISQVRDIAAESPNYSHIKFYVPKQHDEHLAITLVGGKVLGLVHGHQKSKADLLVGWLEGQAAGRSPIGAADITVAGHFHHYRVETYGDDRWLFVSPTMDGGSSWFRNTSGKESRPGVLTFMVNDDGWHDPFLAWT